MEMIVNIVRMVDNDQAHQLSFGDNDSLKTNLAIGFINPKDFENLGLVKSLRIKLSNEWGEVVVEQEIKEEVPEGIILMPVSIWSNQITGIKNGNLVNKNVKVEVQPTRDPPLEFNEIISKIKG